ncbi:MAG: orotidine-5'-phosphate decarboxylase [bacterium]
MIGHRPLKFLIRRKEEMKGFRQKLKERQEKVSSLVCVGLDPLPEKVPECIRGGSLWGKVAIQMKAIVDSTASHALMFKPQKAHYEAIPEGQKALQAIVDHIHYHYPDIPVFLDCKRGDIGRTQERYRIAHFEIDGVDGMNFSPYMGKDCMEWLIDKKNPSNAIVGLCYTSNSSAREVQDVILSDGRAYWEFMAATVLKWAEELEVVQDAGLVMAAAYEKPKKSGNVFSDHLTHCRKIVGNKLWFLIPGIGTQGGFVEETVKTAYAGPGSIAINSSSGITQASLSEDFAEAAAREAKKLRDQINEALGLTGLA